MVSAALLVAPTAGAQAPDTTSPVLTVGSTPSAPVQRNGDPAYGFAPTSISTGNSNWYTSAPVTVNVSATDNVGVAKLQYSTDNGATWVDLPVTGGSVGPFTNEGNNPLRLRAIDAAGNVSAGLPGGASSLNQAATAGATAVRLASTNGRAVGDEIVIDPIGSTRETVRIASIVSPAPASPAPNVTLQSPLQFDHAAATVIRPFGQYLDFAIRIDTKAPTATWPNGVGANNRIGHGAANITPTRTDVAGGSGSPAVREAWLDGTWVYPLPLDASKLSLGKHTWELNITDSAGNGNKVKFTFLVTTSITDLDSMLAKWGTAGTIPAATVTDLRAKIADAKTSATAGDNVSAINKLQAISYGDVTNADARNTLITDTNDVVRQLRGIPDAADPADLGITQTPAAGAPRHLYVPPSAPVRNASPAFKVLVFSNRQGDGSFRHPAIEDAEVAIQELGRKYNFDVDIWDPQYPNAGPSDTPFSSAANLSQYKVVIGDSSVGNSVLSTAYRMKDGTVVNEQTAFQQFIQAGGGYVALHAANDSLHNWGWYKDFLGGLFVSHPANQNGFAPDCGSCYWVEVNNEDPTHPSMAAAGVPRSVAVSDELYHFDRKPRLSNHVLQTLNESTYVGAMGVGTNSGNTEGGDHPIVWCSNYDGGREWSQVLGHNGELYRIPWFRESIYQGILTAGGMKYANCVTHTEVKSLLASLQASGGITAAAAATGTAQIQSAFNKYYTLDKAQISSSLTDIADFRTLAEDPATGDAASRAKLVAKAAELKQWMLVLLGSQDVSGGATGTVPATLALSLGTPAAFGAFTPGVANTYTASSTANVISTAGDATLSVADPSSTATGRLTNGAFSLVNPVQVMASSALGTGAALANVGGSSAPTSVLTYTGPVSNDSVTMTFSQAIGANEPLRTGSYSKTLTFTLSTTTP